MSRLSITLLPLRGLASVTRHPLCDERGFLSRIFCADELRSVGWHKPVAQINHTFTASRGTVRGMHYQRQPHVEMKLVTCLRGEVWDVAIDIRRGSPTFLNWHAEHLSSKNGRALLLPEGFAHGFQALSDDVELLYCHSSAYVPACEAGLHPEDPALSIAWPLPVGDLSLRDAHHPRLRSDFMGVPI